MKVLVCGGRDYEWVDDFYSELDKIEITHIVHGGARGADSLAGNYAEDHCIPCTIYYADWGQYGNAAGPIRNKAMLAEEPDLVVAFPGGKGTANMIKLAKEAGVKVIEIT